MARSNASLPAQFLEPSEGAAAISERWLSFDEPGKLDHSVSTAEAGGVASAIPRSSASIAIPAVPKAPIDLLTDGTDSRRDDSPGSGEFGLLASALPFDGASLKLAIDQCSRQLSEMHNGDRPGRRSVPLLIYSLATASTFAALDLVRRRFRPARDSRNARVTDSLGGTGALGFPEQPGSWSSRLS